MVATAKTVSTTLKLRQTNTWSKVRNQAQMACECQRGGKEDDEADPSPC